LIPEKRYGREREIETLLAAFDHVVNGSRPEPVLVSGYSGGKSAVVNELHKALVPPRGLFASVETRHPPCNAGATLSQSGLQLAFRRFVGVLAPAEHSLTPFLDDSQWLDAATLDKASEMKVNF
jgi:predicted ATPase